MGVTRAGILNFKVISFGGKIYGDYEDRFPVSKIIVGICYSLK